MDVCRDSTRHRAGIVTGQNVKGARFVIVSGAVCELLLALMVRELPCKMINTRSTRRRSIARKVCPSQPPTL
ncbi:hypothetical protein E2C01_000405 [Portunus trituberculatus]|uniref:Uncharacterized protein n=1 Tax=Portunus trituberculatus TaxID=210409 RepID=A0A5B7CF18_PORTR|nr:hypothetical protein [Portunus trituberculatus]